MDEIARASLFVLCMHVSHVHCGDTTIAKVHEDYEFSVAIMIDNYNSSGRLLIRFYVIGEDSSSITSSCRE